MGIASQLLTTKEMALRTAVLPALMLAVLTATLVRVESSPLASDRAAAKTHAQKAESRLFWITLLLAKRRCFETCKAVDFSPDVVYTHILHAAMQRALPLPAFTTRRRR